MNVLVTGASGMLGRALMARLEEAEGITCIGTAFSRARDPLRRLDLCDAAAVEQLLDAERPQVIVHAAAERRPDVSEKDPEGTTALNVAASERLARLASRHGAWLCYLSTDYVFDGSQPPYQPGDTTNPLNFYGTSKRDGEIAVLENAPGAAVLRVPVLYGAVESLDESAITVIAKALLKPPGQPAPMDHWATRYPTHVADVAAVLHGMIEQRAACAGIFHWSGNEACTKYDMAVLINELWGLDHAFVADPEPAPGAPRPRDCHLDASALAALGIGQHTPFRAGLEQALAPFKPNPRGLPC